MKPKARFTNSVIASAKACDVKMPWARGARRAEMIARRTAPSSSLQSRSA